MDRRIILCFRWKVGFDIRFSNQSPFVRSLVYWLDGKFHHELCGKRLLHLDKALIVGERRSFFGDSPM